MRKLIAFGLLTFAAATAFAAPTDLCTTVGYSGKPQNVVSCVNGTNRRTITCAPGYVVKGTHDASVTLPGRVAFAGCMQEDMCAVYGFSGSAQHVESCTNGVNKRTIKCVEGYIAKGTADRSIELTGDARFYGCMLPATGDRDRRSQP